MNINIRIILLLFFILIRVAHLQGQFQGGDDDGYTVDRYVGKLNGSSIQAIFKGGNHDGFGQNGQSSFVQGLNIATIFKGGDDDGYGMERFLGKLNGASFLPIFSGGPGDGFDQAGGNNFFQGAPFPVSLVMFDAFPENEFVIIQWVTESEQNLDFFTVEKSRDARQFTDLLDVPGSGISLAPQAYEETDKEPFVGRSYYRLKSTDFDGSFSYSQIVEVNMETQTTWDFRLFPNPGSGESLALLLSGLEGNSEIHIELINVQGQIIHSNHISPQSPNLHMDIELESQLAAGTYVVRISAGDQQMSKLLVIQTP